VLGDRLAERAPLLGVAERELDVIAYLDDDNAWAAERLMREPG
jgi:hypothetical protein